MQKKRKERCNIKMNDVLNKHLDSMEESVALDVFKPKIGDDNFFNIVEQAIESDSGEKQGKRKRETKVKESKPQNLNTIAFSLVSLLFLSLFIGFLYIAWNILF